MPYHFDESDHEPQTQAEGGGRREPPRTTVLLEMPDEHEYRWPQKAIRLGGRVGMIYTIIFFLGALLAYWIAHLFH